jgi:hypothetical protein
MKSALKLALICALVFSTVSFNTLGQQKSGQSLQKQLVGQWSLVSWEMVDTKGNKSPGVEGADPKGFLMFADNGRFTYQIMSALPKLAKDRLVTTPEENKAVAHGVLSYFGTYTVNEADKTFTFKVERSSYPNQNGLELKRGIQTLSADELKFNNPSRIGAPGVQTNVVWKRLK